jgi:hypothetical protein
MHPAVSAHFATILEAGDFAEPAHQDLFSAVVAPPRPGATHHPRHRDRGIAPSAQPCAILVVNWRSVTAAVTGAPIPVWFVGNEGALADGGLRRLTTLSN